MTTGVLDSKLLSKIIDGVPNYILAALSMLIFAWIILPSFRLAFVEPYAGAITLILTAALALFNPYMRSNIRRIYIVILSVCIITFFVPSGFIFNIGFLPLIEYSIFAFPAILAYVLISERKNTIILSLMAFLAVLVIMVIKSTMQVLIDYPSAARDLAQGIETPQLMEWRMNNVGGFGFAYGVAAIGFLLLSLIMKKSNIVFKTAYIALFVYVSTFIFLAQYTTLLVFYTLGIAFLLFRRINSSALRLILIITGIIILASLKDIMYELANYCNANDLAALGHHFDDFGDAISGKDLRSSRNDLAKRAIDVWLESPIWGVPNSKIPGNVNYLAVMEAHSGVASILGSTGILGLSLTLGFFYLLWKLLRNTLIHRGFSALGLDVSTIFMLIVFFINPIFSAPEISVTTFFIVPAVTYLLNIRNGKEKALAR